MMVRGINPSVTANTICIPTSRYLTDLQKHDNRPTCKNTGMSDPPIPHGPGLTGEVLPRAMGSQLSRWSYSCGCKAAAWGAGERCILAPAYRSGVRVAAVAPGHLLRAGVGEAGLELNTGMTWNGVIACAALDPGDAPGCWQAGVAHAQPAAQRAAPTFGVQVGALQASLKMLRTSRTTCSA